MDTPNFFTFSSDPGWRSFVAIVIYALVLLVIGSYAFILLIDPYDNLSYSPDLERQPVDEIQRLFHPALARKAQFDSAIIGNSNIRLLQPQQLNALLEGDFVNLGMDAASSWEQQRMFNVFVHGREKVNNVIFGLDYLWCYTEYADEKFVGANTVEGFPEWLFDERKDNDFPPLNLQTLEHAWLQLLAVTGAWVSPYGTDGYHVFTGPMSEYNLDKARQNIYGSLSPRKKAAVVPPVKLSEKARRNLISPALKRLQAMMDELPAETKKVLIFTPYHRYYQAEPGSRREIIWHDCKQHVAKLAQEYENAYVIDFMIDSSITSEDNNYWDYKHYNVEVAKLLGELIAQVVEQGTDDSRYRVLHPESF